MEAAAFEAPQPSSSDLAFEIAALLPSLKRWARTKLHNPQWAEDAVSEAVLAALEDGKAYCGLSSRKSWLMGILKHKLTDQIRQHTRYESLGDDDSGDDGGEALEGAGRAFAADPFEHLAERQFLSRVDQALDRLPPMHRSAFLLKECLEKDTSVACQELSVGPGYFGVLVHRARQRLREELAEPRRA